MYLEHFNLREYPFALTPDTSYFLNRAGFQDGLNVLLVALRAGEGFVKVVGEVGTGKTMLCRKLLNVLGDDFATAYLHNPFLSPHELLATIADELTLCSPPRAPGGAGVSDLTSQLVSIHESGRRVVLCMDEVQAMPIETLEALRLLTNLETEKRKLIQVVLFGQPELDDRLSMPAVRQLRQRITFSCRLRPLTRTGLTMYVGHRLAIAGYRGPSLFSPRALRFLHRASRGVPRLVNILGHKALLAAFGQGATQLSLRHVRLAALDTESVALQAGFFGRRMLALANAIRMGRHGRGEQRASP